MSSNYRVHYKKGDVDIEVESTEKDYVDQMLNRLLTLTPIKTATPPSGSSRRLNKTRVTGSNNDEADVTKPAIDVAGIVARIHESDEFDNLEKHILNKASQLPRVLLAFKFAHDSGHHTLTTGDVEAITDQLGIKISQANVSHCISDNKKYFTAGTVRKKGAKVPYKINRQGALALTKVIAGEKV